MTLPTPRLSIRTWLILLVLAFVLPLGTLLIQHLIVEEDELARAAAYANVQELARSTAARLELTLRDHEAMLSLIATEFRGNPPVRARRFQPAQFMDIHPQVINLAVHDLHANNIYSYLSSPVSAESAAQFPWIQQALRDETFTAGDAFFGHLSGRWVSVWRHPVYGEDGVRTGIVSASIDLLQLNARLLKAPVIPKGVSVAVLDREGKFLLRSIDPEKWIGQPGPDVGTAVDTVQREGLVAARSVEGIEKMVAFVTLPHTGWRVVAGVPEAQAMAGYRARRDQGLALVLAIVLLVLVLAWRIASAIVNPIRALAEAAAKGAQGGSLVRVVPSSPAEIEFVGRQFNTMQDARMQTESALRESESRWKFALEGSGDGLWDRNISDGTLYVSARYKEILGYQDGEVGPTFEQWAGLVHLEDLPATIALLQSLLEGRSESYTAEYRMLCKDGKYKWFISRGMVLSRDLAGKPLRAVGTLSDISERKRVEADLRIGATAFESQQSMFILDENRKFIRINRAFSELLGFTIDEVLGETPEIIVFSDRLDPKAHDAIWAHIALDGESSDEITVRRKTGERIAVWSTLTIVKNDTAKITHYVGTLTDITDRKRLQVQRAEEELAQRNVLVREVHHRVKNSLQGVVGILREFGRNHPETMEPISQAVGQVQSIAVIHGLQGRSTLDQVRLCELTAEVAAGIDSLWHTSINVAIPAQWVPCLITEAEAVPVALVLNELILNAVKHGDTAYGGVTVTLQKGERPCMVRICIMNGGMWKSVTGGAHVGLQLVDSLMPRDGAKLIRVLHSDSTCTTLELGPPVISLEIIESI